jgi:hypothetical protein
VRASLIENPAAVPRSNVRQWAEIIELDPFGLAVFRLFDGMGDPADAARDEKKANCDL